MGIQKHSLIRILGITFGILISSTIFTDQGEVQAQQQQDPDQGGIPQDKAMHFGIAATAQTGCYAVAKPIVRSKWIAQGTCFVAINTAGALKEMGDKGNGGTREMGDIYANMAGSGLSMFVLSIAF